MRRIPKWLIVLTAIVLVCVGVKMWYDRLCYGEIDISGSAPSKEMLLHIAANAKDLLSDERFNGEMNDDGSIDIIRFTDIDALAYLQFSGSPDYYYAAGKYARNDEPNLFFLRTPWSAVDLYFTISAPGMLLVVNQYDSNSISDAPLREMMDAIISVIGTP